MEEKELFDKILGVWTGKVAAVVPAPIYLFYQKNAELNKTCENLMRFLKQELGLNLN